MFFKNAAKWLYNTIKSFTFKDWIIVALAILAVRYMISSHYYKGQAGENVIIVNDSISFYKNKLKEEYTAKNLYIQEAKDLKKRNQELYDEVKSLKDNPLVVTKTKFVVRTDTIVMKSDSIYVAQKDSTANLYWSSIHPDGYYTIKGLTTVNTSFSNFTTKMTDLSIPVTMTTDIIEKDKQLMIISKTNNPFVKITNMDGVFLDPTKSKVLKKQFKPSHWSLGLHVGYGVNADTKFGEVRFGPTISIGINYSLLQF